MKTKDLVFGLVTAASILAADARADLFGKYQVIKNQCSTNLSIGSDVQIRTGDDGDFELGRFEKDLDQTFFKAAFAYTVGISKRPCLGDCYDLFEGTFVSENEFQVVHTFVDLNGTVETPRLAGKTNFVLVGADLTITTTDQHEQPDPWPAVTCLLRKVR